MRPWRCLLGIILAARALAVDAQNVEKRFLNRSVRVDGYEYPYRIYVPPGWSKDTDWPVVLSLHGGGGYGSDGVSQTAEGLAPAILRHPERFPALAVFPQVPANGTPGWQAIGSRIALGALDRTISEFRGDKSRVTLTGLSIGGNGAWYMAYHHPERFAGLLVICGFVAERKGSMYPIIYPSLVPGPADPSVPVARKIAHIPVWIFHGAADRTVPVEQSRRMAAALRASGADVQYTELPGIDHNSWDIAYERPDVAKWLLNRRRLTVPSP